MSLPLNEPSPEQAAPVTSPTNSPQLGRIALWLGIGTVICGVLQVVFSLIIPPRGPLGAIPMLGFPLGIAAAVVGIIAIVKRRGRREGIIGLILAAAAGPVAWLLGFLYIMASLMLHYGV